MDTCDLNVVANPTALIAVPASHEKAESQSTTLVSTAYNGLLDPLNLPTYTSIKVWRFQRKIQKRRNCSILLYLCKRLVSDIQLFKVSLLTK
ncbi:hypothetical protein VCHA53O466_110116 [Vibrio chagasii]|nr:hypothetical protein VCHA53O466_110116 [Vibrio chagasii]